MIVSQIRPWVILDLRACRKKAGGVMRCNRSGSGIGCTAKSVCVDSFAFWVSSTLLFLALGCGSNSTSPSKQPTPPASLTYPQPTITATVGVAISVNTPTVTGTASSYSISPALPAGLSLDMSSGAISGTPTTLSASAIYNITASNSAGSTGTTVQITVNSAGDFAMQISQQSVFVPIGFSSQSLQVSAIAVNGFSGEVSVSITGLPQGVTSNPAGSFTMAPGSSQIVSFSSTTNTQPGLQQVSFQATSVALSHSATVSLSIARPAYAYLATTASNGSAPFHLLGYAVDANTGSLASVPGTAITLTDKAIQLVTASETGGTFLYVMTNTGQPGNSYGLLSYKIDAATGTLTPIQQNSLGTTTGWWMTLHPSGKFLYLRRSDPNNNQNCWLVYLVDPNTGNLSQSSCTAEDAFGLEIPPPGNFAYLTDSSYSIKLYSVDLNSGSLSSVQSQPLMQYSYISMVHPSGRALYTGQVQPPGSMDPNCTAPQTWDIDPQSGLLTSEGFYYYEFEYCWVSLSFMNLSGTHAYSYHRGPYQHDIAGWSLLDVDPNNWSLSEGANIGLPPTLPTLALVPDGGAMRAEPTQGKYFVAFTSAVVLESIPVDSVTGVLSNPVATLTVGESLNTALIPYYGFVVVSPQN